MEDPRKKAIKLYTKNKWEYALSVWKFWEEPYEVIEKMIPGKGVIVELGCGEGLLTNYLALAKPKSKIIGFEIVPERLEIAKKGIKNTNYKVANIVDLPFPKADVFILFHVLHHLPSKDAQELVLKKVKQSLNKGGKLIIVDVYIEPSFKYWGAWIADHFLVPWVFENRFYTRAYFRKATEWAKLLKKLGYNANLTLEIKGRPFPNLIFECK